MHCWYKIKCVECQSTNWVDNGDLDDMTIGDVEAFQCWNCGVVNYLGEDIEALEEGEKEGMFVEQGLKSPI